MAGVGDDHGLRLTSDEHATLHSLLDIIHFNYPWVLAVVFLVAFVIHSIRSAESHINNAPVLLGPGGKPLPRTIKKSDRERYKLEDFSPIRKWAFINISAAVILTYLGNAVNIIVHALAKRDSGWWCGEAKAIYVCASAFFYSIFLISLVDSTPSPTIAHQVTWIVGLAGEITLLIASTILYTSPHEEVNSLRFSDRPVIEKATDWEIIDITIASLRTVLLMLIANSNSHVSNNGTISNGNAEHGRGENGIPVLASAPGTAHGDQASVEENVPAFYKPTTVPVKSWWEYLTSYSLFFPYLWPAKSLRLKLVVVVCFCIVVCQRAINVLVPIQMGVVTNQLSNKDGWTGMPWLAISLLIAFKFMQGSSGILGAARSVLWIPISQYSYQALTTASFEHVHSLSLDFHLGNGNAINNFLEQVTFSIIPMVFDLGFAIVYFGLNFDAYYALIVGVITFMYLYLTIRMARWRSQQRRSMTNLSREEDAVKNDSLTSYETVKYFNAEVYEFARYRAAVTAFQAMEYKVTISLNILNITQNMVFMTGLLLTSFLMAFQVTIGKREVGDFVALLTYMAQLQAPLNFFGTFYRTIQNSMISGERLLELFREQPTVIDDATATEMPTCEGHIRFQNVKFSYDERKPALEDLSFTCKPGTTTAFVGESGGGKSTVFRLLFRFYNAQSGSIQVDGNDVKNVTIDSVRRHIGVVPQDTVLFNETLMYNLRYANQDATDEDIYAACTAASIHDKIMLSGGEKQRVAIARTILKNPRIIMLDEATAALDSDTEQNIQEALKTLSKGRTMLVIAHRLSTVTSADQILVLHAGRVAESGSHEELLAMKGRYANMWKKQIRAERAATVASAALAKAKALQESALARPTSAGNQDMSSGDVSENENDGPKKPVNLQPSDSDPTPRATPRTTVDRTSSDNV
ncbi:putative heavy metal tolerance protein [Bisporella sp. PMI_857]|nr:putative heavy metal tolerance protein [Bisporella sp. PMI_857]